VGAAAGAAALAPQATSDLSNGANAVAGVGAIIAAACGASSNVPCAAVAGIISGYLWAMASVISLMNRGNGVYLTIPWTSFLPLMPKIVIPTPR
jgi:outer membrane lipoprotein SlyB